MSLNFAIIFVLLGGLLAAAIAGVIGYNIKLNPAAQNSPHQPEQ